MALGMRDKLISKK